jgi:acyl-CoA synthetase (AMP-forming)/AMP-acid ligase II
MPTFSTLTGALDAVSASAHGVHYIAGESSERFAPYPEMRARSLGLLHHLQSAGARPGGFTLLLVDGLAPFIDTFWACVLGRVVAVPLAPGNADEHKAKFFRVLARLPSPTLATERKVFDRLRTYANDNGLADAVEGLERRTLFLDEINDVSVPGVEHRANADDTAFIQFSSGSTSEPKGVVLTHRNLTTNIDAILSGIAARDDETSLSWMPLTHDMGLIGFHLTPLFQDADHWLMPTALFVRRPGLWMAKAAEHRVSITCSPNFGYMHYLKSHDAAKTAALDLSRVRIIFNGAEPIAADLCRDFLAALAPAKLAPNVMFPVYGLAEASLAVTFPRPGAPLAVDVLSRGTLGPGDAIRTTAAAADDAVELVRVGRPVEHCEVRIADESGDAVAEGIVGRILIRGDNVSPAYYDDPELTQASRTKDGFLDTGDLGAMHGGELVVTGRTKEILFVAGQNHYPQDIDLVLAQHAGLELGRSAAAGTRPAHAATDDVLVFVLNKGDDLAAFAQTARTVRRVVNERMGLAVAAVVPVRQFPKTTSGKIQRFALARDYEEGRFAPVLAELAKHDVASGAVAATDLEQTLLAICEAALPNRKLSPDDNLFEIGTGSLTLAQIYEKVEATYPGYLEVTDFFEYPTVRSMAAFLAHGLADARRLGGLAGRRDAARRHDAALPVYGLPVLPLAVQPQPVGRAAADLLLELARVVLDDLRSGLAVVRRLGEQRQLDEITAAPVAPHGDVDHRRLDDLGDLVGAHEERGVLVEEARPVLLLVVLGSVIGDKRVGAHVVAPLHHLEHVAPVGDRVAAEARTARAQEFVDTPDFLRLVNGVDGHFQQYTGSKQQPFPIAEVRRQQHDRLAARGEARDELGIDDAHAAGEGLRARVPAPQRFSQEAAEVAVRLGEDGVALGCALVRKGIGDVGGRERSPPAHDAIHDHVRHIPEPVEHSPRPARHAAEHEAEQIGKAEALVGEHRRQVKQ